MPTSAISTSAQRQPATPMDYALPQVPPHTRGTTRPLAAMTGCCNRTGETPVAALAPSICKNYFRAASSLAARSLLLKKQNSSEFSWKLAVSGKQRISEFPA
jgi:hypothetical protein